MYVIGSENYKRQILIKQRNFSFPHDVSNTVTFLISKFLKKFSKHMTITAYMITQNSNFFVLQLGKIQISRQPKSLPNMFVTKN